MKFYIISDNFPTEANDFSLPVSGGAMHYKYVLGADAMEGMAFPAMGDAMPTRFSSLDDGIWRMDDGIDDGIATLDEGIDKDIGKLNDETKYQGYLVLIVSLIL